MNPRNLGIANQGHNERIVYTIDFASWGIPEAPVCTLTNLSSGENVSTSCLEGSASVEGTNVLTPIVKSLSINVQYRLEISATFGTSTLSAFLGIIGED